MGATKSIQGTRLLDATNSDQGAAVDSSGNVAIQNPSNLDVAASTLATETKLEAVRALLQTIDADTSNLDVALSTVATETKLEAVRALLATIDADTSTLAAVDYATDTVLQAVRDRIGEISATPTTNTLQDRLKELEATLTSIDGKDFATETKLEAVRALLQTIDADTSNLDVALSTIATDAVLQAVRDRIGEISATPTANTVMDRLKELEATLTSIDGKDFATETKLEAVRALLQTIDADTSNLDVLLSTRASESTLTTADGRLTTIDAVLDSIKDTDGIKKITDQLPAGTNEIGAVAQGTKASGTGAWPQVLYDASGNAVGVILDGSVYRLQASSKLQNTSDTYINPATQDTLADVETKLTDVVDAGNSSTSQLAASASFTGTGVDCLTYSSVTVVIHSDVDSASGGMKFEWSQDNTNWDDVISWTLDASDEDTRRFEMPVTSRYFRVNYENNDSTATTEFRVQTILHRRALNPSWTASKVVKLPSGELAYVEGYGGGGASVTLSNPDGDPIGHESGSPVYVTASSSENREFLPAYAIAVDLPAELISGNSTPFDVGGETLTLTVNGTADNHTFPTRAATAGIAYSAQNPAITNGGEDNMKVRIDGGAETEITIAKNLYTDALAAAIQAQIRAVVPNGTNVTVEYNPVDYPGRYVITSGTTGSGSSVWVKNDKLGNVNFLKLAVEAGGKQIDGLDADYYHAFEVAGELNDHTAGVVCTVTDADEVRITTVELGSSATLQVGAGGANTALGYSTTQVTGTAGTGSNNMNVVGTLADPVRYSIVADSIYTFNVEKIKFLIRDDGEQLKKFGGLAQLTNGVVLETRTAGGNPREWFTAVTNSELIANTDSYELMLDAYDAGGQDLLVCTIHFDSPVVLRPGSVEAISILVQDDLTGLNSFQLKAEGWLEVI